MKKTVKKTAKKTAKKTVRQLAAKPVLLSTTMDVETVLARMVDMPDINARITVLAEFMRGLPGTGQVAILSRMSREASGLLLSYAKATTSPVTRGVLPAPAKTETPSVPKAEAVAPAVGTPAVLPPAIVTATIGGYSSRWAADQDVLQFKHPNVMTYRTTVFPSTTTYRVTAKVEEAQVIEVKDLPKRDSRQMALDRVYPFAVTLSVSVTGPGDNVANWLQAFNRLNHSMQVNG